MGNPTGVKGFKVIFSVRTYYKNRHAKDVSFVLQVNKQSNLIMVPAEFDVTFPFPIYLCSQSTINKMNVVKISQMFSADGNFLYLRFKIDVVCLSQILLLMAKYFILD